MDLLNQFSVLELLLVFVVFAQAFRKTLLSSCKSMGGLSRAFSSLITSLIHRSLLHTGFVTYSLYSYGPAVFTLLGYKTFVFLFAVSRIVQVILSKHVLKINAFDGCMPFAMALKTVLVLQYGTLGGLWPSAVSHAFIEVIHGGDVYNAVTTLTGIICGCIFHQYYTKYFF